MLKKYQRKVMEEINHCVILNDYACVHDTHDHNSSLMDTKHRFAVTKSFDTLEINDEIYINHFGFKIVAHNGKILLQKRFLGAVQHSWSKNYTSQVYINGYDQNSTNGLTDVDRKNIEREIHQSIARLQELEHRSVQCQKKDK